MSSHPLLLLALGILVGLLPSRADGADAIPITEFPTVARVLTEIKGKNERDTQARQIGALTQLWHMVASLTGGRAETQAESQLRQTYNLALGKLNQPVMASFDPKETAAQGMRSPRARWVALCSLYESDEALRDEILTRFFSPQFRARWGKAIAEGHRVQRHSDAELAQSDAAAAPQWLQDMPWYKGPAWVLLTITTMSALGFAVGMFRLWTHFGLSPTDPHLFRGRKTLRLRAWTGVVTNNDKQVFRRSEEYRIPNPHPNPLVADPGRMEKVTVTQLHTFTLAMENGAKRDCTFPHHHAQVENGDRFTVIEFGPRDEDWGNPLIYWNHRTGKRTSHPELSRLMRPSWVAPVCGAVLSACLLLYFAAARDYSANQSNFPTLFDYSGAIAQKWPDFVAGWLKDFWLKAFALLIAWWVFFHGLPALRAARFVKKGAQAFYERVKVA